MQMARMWRSQEGLPACLSWVRTDSILFMMVVDLDKEKKDICSKEIENAGPDAPFYAPEEEKALVRKIDLVLLPMVWIMYLLSYMDRTKYVSSFNWEQPLTGGQYWKCKDLRHGNRSEPDVERILHLLGRLLYRICCV